MLLFNPRFCMHHFILFESAHVEAGSDFAVITLLSF